MGNGGGVAERAFVVMVIIGGRCIAGSKHLALHQCLRLAGIGAMADSDFGRDDLLRLQDLVLLQQAGLHDISHRIGRRRSAAEVQILFRDLQQVLQPELTLEIGAHAAPFSQEMARRGIEAHAFEANPYNHQAYVGRLARRAPDVRYHHMAVSDVDGETTFQIRKGEGGRALRKAGNNSLLKRQSGGENYETVTVPACRLQSFLSDNGLLGRTFSAWIDVEGALGKVTSGFGTALQSCLSLIVEVEEKRIWQDQMLAFDVMVYLDREGMVPVARDFEYTHQYNMVYLRKDVFQMPLVRLVLARFLSVSHAEPAPPAHQVTG
jgi:FkbM family methyltransferase